MQTFIVDVFPPQCPGDRTLCEPSGHTFLGTTVPSRTATPAETCKAVLVTQHSVVDQDMRCSGPCGRRDYPRAGGRGLLIAVDQESALQPEGSGVRGLPYPLLRRDEKAQHSLSVRLYWFSCHPDAVQSPLPIQRRSSTPSTSQPAAYMKACVLGMAEFRRCGFAEINFGPATMLTVGVKTPATEHSVSVNKVRAWLSQVRSPREQIEKARLRKLLLGKE